MKINIIKLLIFSLHVSFLSTVCFALSDERFVGMWKEARKEVNLKERLKKYEKVLEVGSDGQRFFIQSRAAKLAFEVSEYEKANKLAKEVLAIRKRYENELLYGSAVHDAHTILGRLALNNSNIELAKEHLILSAKVPNSPRLRSFGPSMKLASDLLALGQNDITIQYLELCKNFWELGIGILDLWIAEIREGKEPNFSPNIRY